MLSRETIDRIQPTDPRLLAQAQARLDRLTKPIGSLGRLEELAACYVMITGEMKPKVPRGAVFTFAADHGVTVEGVSAYPSAVTPQMVLNFLRGGAGVNVLARHAGIEVRVVDIGVAFDFEAVPGLIHRKVMPGTKNLMVESAMSRAQAEQALQVGIELATEAAQEGIGLIGTGEMGIGNTTASSAITAVMTRRPVSEVTGRGTGIDDAGHARKIDVIQRALDLHRLDPTNAMEVLAKVGGLEIGGLAGLMLGAAAARIPVVLDGFIAGAAALIAVGLQPRCKDYLIASHRSVERGHQAILGSSWAEAAVRSRSSSGGRHRRLSRHEFGLVPRSRFSRRWPRSTKQACRSVTHDRGVANVSVRLAVPHGDSTQPFDARCQAGGVGCLHELVSLRWLSPWRCCWSQRICSWRRSSLHPGHEYALDAPAYRRHARASPGRAGRYGGRFGRRANPSGASGDHAGCAHRRDRRNGTISRARPAIRRAQCAAGGRAYRVADRHAGGRSVGHGGGGVPCDLCAVRRRIGPTVPRACVLATPMCRDRHGRSCVDVVVGAMAGLVLSSHRHGPRSSFDGLVSSYVRRCDG